jgi:hypothetical protein
MSLSDNNYIFKNRWMASYRRDRRRLEKDGYDLSKLDSLERIILLGIEPDKDKHKPHNLKIGQGWCECHVTKPTDDWVVLFKLEIKNGQPKVLFRSTGTHEHVFQKKHFKV